MRTWSCFAVAMILAACGSLFALQDAFGQSRTVAIGYIPTPNPWLYPAGDGTFERETGYKINWVRLDTSNQVIQALHEGRVQIGYSDSVPIAIGMSGGVDMELFWIASLVEYSEALIGRNLSKVTDPQSLRGKKIATPFWSSCHYQTIFALEQFDIPANKVELYNMSPDEIVANWRRGTIDAACVSYPALERLLPDARIMAWAGWIGRWGRPTFRGFVANRKWSAANPEFMAKFVEIIEATNGNYRANPARWTSTSPEVRSIVAMVGHQANIPPQLAALTLLESFEQQSPRGLGGGKTGMAAKSLQDSAKILENFGMIKKALDDYSAFVTPKWAEAAVAEQEKRTRVAPERVRK